MCSIETHFLSYKPNNSPRTLWFEGFLFASLAQEDDMSKVRGIERFADAMSDCKGGYVLIGGGRCVS